MYKFKTKFLYTKSELLNFKITLPLAKLDMLRSRLVSNNLIFSDEIQANIKLATFLLLCNISELSIRVKTKNFS